MVWIVVRLHLCITTSAGRHYNSIDKILIKAFNIQILFLYDYIVYVYRPMMYTEHEKNCIILFIRMITQLRKKKHEKMIIYNLSNKAPSPKQDLTRQSPGPVKVAPRSIVTVIVNHLWVAKCIHSRTLESHSNYLGAVLLGNPTRQIQNLRCLAVGDNHGWQRLSTEEIKTWIPSKLWNKGNRWQNDLIGT